MTWLTPHWLLALPLVWGLLWLVYRHRREHSDWQRWVDEDLLKAMQLSPDDHHKMPSWHWLFGFILSLLIVALAGPSWQQREQPLLAPASARVLIIDLSASMQATDIRPSRIERAREYLLSIIEDGFEGETALIAFSGQVYVVSPLTRDTNTLRRFVTALRPEQMPSEGSRLDQAIVEAADLLTTSLPGRGTIIAISDGVDAPEAARLAARNAYQANLEFNLIGVGTAEGAPLSNSRGELIRDQQGQIQLMTTDFDSLREAAEAGGGWFLKNPEIPAIAISSAIGNRLATQADTGSDNVRIAPENGGFWLLWLALPMLVLLFRRNALPVLLVAIVLTGHTEKTSAAEWTSWWLNENQQAWRALQSNQPAAAVERATDPLLQGYARYQIADYRGVLELPGLEQSADGLYLRGNAMVQLGLMRQAMTTFEQSLALRPDHSAARYNLALVRFYLQQQVNAAESENQLADSADDNSDILGQDGSQNAMAAGSVEGESSEGDTTGLGAGAVKEIGRVPGEEIDAAIIDAELQQIINSLRQQTDIPQQEQLRRWAETLNADLGELFQRKFLRDYQRATGDR